MTDHTKLNDAERCALVAERVLRLSLCGGRWWKGNPPVMLPYNLFSWSGEFLCSCLSSWSGIGLVVDAMEKKGYQVALDHCLLGEPWECSFYPNVIGTHVSRAADPLPWRAVHLAALAALEER